MSDIPLLFLAAGQSRRMRGRDKLLEQIDGIALLRRQVLRALESSVGPAFVAVPDIDHPRAQLLADLDVEIIAVPDASKGMNVTLSRGLSQMPDTSGAVMVLLADMPDLTASDLVAVKQAYDDNPEHLIWRASTGDGKPGHPVIFARRIWPELMALEGDAGGREVTNRYAAETYRVALPDDRARLDLDTPEQWKDWRAAHAT
ncbi:NTP transferase domain-containing protein [Sulfitobacter sp. S190]|uniref:nucleotidyltransferase family protein n=1 Tax=Sulfitobacter sp. S190 TaxID=2867022 RepID=UPI0021A89EEA|nr:nucleotidyltransferase family protein [Sulfitobacter sp. S190]UWR20908.1 nucleotidyltransferase family protein [Sulfitobacter sp. S190]